MNVAGHSSGAATKRRRRLKQTAPLQDRLLERADQLRREGAALPPCRERTEMLDRARQMLRAAYLVFLGGASGRR